MGKVFEDFLDVDQRLYLRTASSQFVYTLLAIPFAKEKGRLLSEQPPCFKFEIDLAHFEADSFTLSNASLRPANWDFLASFSSEASPLGNGVKRKSFVACR